MIGCLNKMPATLSPAGVAEYELPLGEQRLALNELLGKRVQLNFTGRIQCVVCGRAIKKAFSQGHCFPCVRKLASCDICIVRPELCHFDQGTCREPDWGKQWCMDTHYVYVSVTSAIKVGITRHSNIPSRWIDQGASEALPVYRVATRQLSGLIEKVASSHIDDKTNWRAMLTGKSVDIDLKARARELVDQLLDRVAQINDQFHDRFGEQTSELLSDQSIVKILYPVLQLPAKINSHNFDKQGLVEGTLLGIKGQYLILDTGVINIRKFTGYEIAASVD